MDTATFTPLMIPSVWPLELVLESTLIVYGSAWTWVVTAPSGPWQLWNASFAAVPTFTGEAAVWVPVGTFPEVVEAGVVLVLEQVTLTLPSVSTVFEAFAVYEPPFVILTLRVVAAIAGAALRPTTAPAAPRVARTVVARLNKVMGWVSLIVSHLMHGGVGVDDLAACALAELATGEYVTCP